MSACLVSFVPELDSHLSFIDLCCIFAEETNDKLADLWQQQHSSAMQTQHCAQRAQLTHLNTTLLTLISSMQQLHSTVAECRVEEDDEEAEEQLTEEDETAGGEEAEAEAEAEKENEQPVEQQLANNCKHRTADTDIRRKLPHSTHSTHSSHATRSILASPAHFDSIAQQHAALQSSAFATPASNNRGRRASACCDGKSANSQSSLTSILHCAV